MEQTERPRFSCDTCGKSFHRRDYLSRHRLNHLAPQYKCPVCQAAFTRDDVQRKHTLKCSGGSVPPGDDDSRSRVASTPDHDEGQYRKRRRKRTMSSSQPAARPSLDTRPESPPHVGDSASSNQPAASRADSFYAGPTSFPEMDDFSGHGNGLGGEHDLAGLSGTSMTSGIPNGHNDSMHMLTGGSDLMDGGSNGLWPVATGSMEDLISWMFVNKLDKWNGGPMGLDVNGVQDRSTQPGMSDPMASGMTGSSILTPSPHAAPTNGSSTQGSAMHSHVFHSAAWPTQDEYSAQAVPNRIAQNLPVGQNTLVNISQARHPHAQPVVSPLRNGDPYPSGYDVHVDQDQYGGIPLEPQDVITEGSREAMLGLLEGPLQEEARSGAWTVQAMQLYFELYFIHFDTLYPIIHRPSLGYRHLPADLLLTMLCIGSAFAHDRSGFELATRIHKRLRSQIFESVEEDPRPSHATLQCILLLNHFSRSYCSQVQHDVSQIFHSPAINMTRLSGAFLPKFTRSTRSNDSMTCWLTWIQDEERIRLAWFAFLSDTENAALYRHLLLCHCWNMQIDLPSVDSVWTATDHRSWASRIRSAPKVPSFRNALRELAGLGVVPAGLTDFSMWILIHGLVSVSWTLLWRDLSDLSMVPESKITVWKDSLYRGSLSWRTCMQERMSLVTATGGSAAQLPVYWAGLPFSSLAIILLLTDTEQIRIFAGAISERRLLCNRLAADDPPYPDVAGRQISPGEWMSSSAYASTWAHSEDGSLSCHAAVELLTQVYSWSHESRFQTSPTIVSWCLYIATLVIWSYTSILEGQDSLRGPYIIPGISSPASPHPEPIIEPSLARNAALEYCAMMSRLGPSGLPSGKGMNRCAGIIAYTAYLAGTLPRGVMVESRRVLLGLLTEFT